MLRRRRKALEKQLDSMVASQSADSTSITTRSYMDMKHEINSITRQINDLAGVYPTITVE